MKRNAAIQEVDEREREEVALSPATIGVTWKGGATFEVSNKRSGVYQHGDTVTWKIKGAGFKKGDTLTISSFLPRFSFSYQGTCAKDGQDFDVSGTVAVPFPKPVLYTTWGDPEIAPKRLVQYSLVRTPAPVRPRSAAPGLLDAEPNVPGDNDPCLVIDTSGGPTGEPGIGPCKEC